MIVRILLSCWVLATVPTVSAQRNNVCSSYFEFVFMRTFSNSCWYDPNIDLDMPELVTQHNYKVETYFATTNDGYILQLFRLPAEGTRRGVIYLQHPATATCAIWVDKGNASLAYALHNVGYEVWLGNFRGSYYSRNHTTLNPDVDKSYWDFSYHEMGIYDLPTQIETIHSISKAGRIAVIGHSMAATAAAIYASLMRDHALEYVSMFIMMAPPIFFSHTSSPIKFVVPFRDFIYAITKNLGIYELIPRTKHSRKEMKICYDTFLINTCTYFIGFMFGFPSQEPYIPYNALMFSQTPGGVSAKTVHHYAQAIADADNKFRYYNYGEGENQIRYNQSEPKLYPIENIKSSFVLMSGSQDTLTNTEDGKMFYEILERNSGAKQVFMEVDGYAHHSFLQAKDINEKVNIPIIQILEKLPFT